MSGYPVKKWPPYQVPHEKWPPYQVPLKKHDPSKHWPPSMPPIPKIIEASDVDEKKKNNLVRLNRAHAAFFYDYAMTCS